MVLDKPRLSQTNRNRKKDSSPKIAKPEDQVSTHREKWQKGEKERYFVEYRENPGEGVRPLETKKQKKKKRKPREKKLNRRRSPLRGGGTRHRCERAWDSPTIKRVEIDLEKKKETKGGVLTNDHTTKNYLDREVTERDVGKVGPER